LRSAVRLPCGDQANAQNRFARTLQEVRDNVKLPDLKVSKSTARFLDLILE